MKKHFELKDLQSIVRSGDEYFVSFDAMLDVELTISLPMYTKAGNRSTLKQTRQVVRRVRKQETNQISKDQALAMKMVLDNQVWVDRIQYTESGWIIWAKQDKTDQPLDINPELVYTQAMVNGIQMF